MFFGRSKIEKYCRNLITAMVNEVSTESKLLLEQHWDKRIQTLSNLEKSIQENLETRLEQVQARVDLAVGKLSKLCSEVMDAGKGDDAAVGVIKENDRKRMELMSSQAKASDAYREKTTAHLDIVQEQHEKQTAAVERIAEAIENVSPVLGRVERVIEELTGAIDDFRKPPPKPKKKG